MGAVSAEESRGRGGATRAARAVQRRAGIAGTTLEEGEGGNEWVTCRPHMSEMQQASYVAVNASVVWSKPLNVGQNSLTPAQVL